MCLEKDQFDISSGDFNPTFLFACKSLRQTDEANYHCHDFMEIAFILAGQGQYRINGCFYPVSQGDVVLLNPGDYHQSLVTAPANPCLEFYAAFTNFQFKNMEENHFTFDGVQYVLPTDGEIRQNLFKLCTSMSKECASGEPGSYFMLRAYLTQFILLILRGQMGTKQKTASGCSFDSTNRTYVVEQMLNYFEDHYDEKISLDKIARNMYLSPFYISKIFKNETGDTPINHLIKIRLEKARDLLETGEAPSIQKAASFVGYEDVYHFSKLFKKHYGISPSQIKNNTAKKESVVK